MLNANSFSQQAGFVEGKKKKRVQVSNFPYLGHVYKDKSSSIRGASIDASNQSKENTAHLIEQTFNPI